MKLSEQSHYGKACYGFRLTSQLQDVDYPDMYVEELPDIDNSSTEKSLFDIVFSVDPDTLLPVGDIAMLLSDKTHPDVKLFIERNLMNPVDLSSDGSGQFAGLSDDDIQHFTRGRDESYDIYRRRVWDSLVSNIKDSRKVSKDAQPSE